MFIKAFRAFNRLSMRVCLSSKWRTDGQFVVIDLIAFQRNAPNTYIDVHRYVCVDVCFAIMFSKMYGLDNRVRFFV